MSRILHLSDLHLGSGEAAERDVDDKVGIVPANESTRVEVLKTAISSLPDSPPHAVVVSGDLTTQNDKEGFHKARALLDGVGLDDATKIVLVPGNHDVNWDAKPGTPEKYELFLESARDLGATFPYCDGAAEAGDPSPVLELPDALVVAINSSNWCGTVLPEDETGSPYDIARISEDQITRLTETLRDIDIEDRILIGVLHHNTTPITEREEAKHFETLTNLARLRAWLREHAFHIVLHGHKHSPTITWDHVQNLSDFRAEPRRILTVSAPRPSGWGSPVFRELVVGTDTGRKPVAGASRVAVRTYEAQRAERDLPVEIESVPLGSASVGDPAVIAIDAMTSNAVYERLFDCLERSADRRLRNVVCVVRDAASAETPPANYAFAEGYEPPTDMSKWLNDTVRWWQLPSPALVASGAAAFNHGERVQQADASGRTPLEKAAERIGSTKAISLVMRPNEAGADVESPALVAVQLVRSGDRLDCVGFFRKQDLTQWWPVNVAELRMIQKGILDLETVDDELTAGNLVTIAVEAVSDDVMPQLSGTRIDRAVDLYPETLTEMAYKAVHGGPDADALWSQNLKDIGKGDFPSLGLERLISDLGVFKAYAEVDETEALIRRLEALRDRAFRARELCKTGSQRKDQLEDLFELAGEVLMAVSAMQSVSDPTPPSDSDGKVA